MPLFPLERVWEGGEGTSLDRPSPSIRGRVTRPSRSTRSRTHGHHRHASPGAARHGGSSSGWIPDTAGFTPHQRQSSSDELCTVKDLNKLTTPKSGPGRLRVDRGWGAGLDRLELLTQLLAGEVQVVRLLQIEP
jgi:hypothetical protein